MKEMISQYARTAIAGMTVLLLLGLLFHLPGTFGKMLQETQALVQQESHTFETCWRLQ